MIQVSAGKECANCYLQWNLDHPNSFVWNSYFFKNFVTLL